MSCGTVCSPPRPYTLRPRASHTFGPARRFSRGLFLLQPPAGSVRMRTIQVSADVFQAIWAARKPGQDSEEAILRGVFGLKPAAPPERDMTVTIGYHDSRYGVEVPSGFEIFR